MGVLNQECVIASTENNEVIINLFESWLFDLDDDRVNLFTVSGSLANGLQTIFLAPDGSKKGWPESERGQSLRDKFIDFLIAQDDEDGSNPFSWVEIGFGEFGQTVLRGNNKNKYDDREYCHYDAATQRDETISKDPADLRRTLDQEVHFLRQALASLNESMAQALDAANHDGEKEEQLARSIALLLKRHEKTNESKMLVPDLSIPTP